MARKRSGCSSARCSAMRPPIEQPIRIGRSSSSAVMISRIIVVYCAEVSWYSSSCQPAGGDDLPCQGMSKAMTRWFARDARVVHQRRGTGARRARGVQAQQRRALAGLLDIDAVRPAEQIEMHVAADDRLESRAHALGSFGAQLGQRFLEVAKIGHEDLQVALGLQHAPLDQRHQVVRARRRPLAPEFLPFLFRARAAQRPTTASRTARASPTRSGPRRSRSARRSGRLPGGTSSSG